MTIDRTLGFEICLELESGFSRLDQAFDELEEAGYFVRHNFSCCQSCGWSQVPDEHADKVVFYSDQDRQHLRSTGELYLCWSGDARFICEMMHVFGMKTEWDGSQNTRVLVKVFERPRVQ